MQIVLVEDVQVIRTKLTSVMANPNHNHPEFNEIVSPLLEPATQDSKAIVDQLLSDLGCLSNRPTTNAKARMLLSSFLMQAQRLENRFVAKGSLMIIGWPHDEAYWRVRSKIGYTLARKLRIALIKYGWMSHHVTAEINLDRGEGNCHGYLIADGVPSKAIGLAMQSNDSLIYATKSSALRTKVTDRKIDQRTKALWTLWKQAPLTYRDQKMWTAHRSFSDEALAKGGRLYGAWTSMNKEEARLHCTIDGKQVAEVDVSGMYLTLLASITGKAPFSGEFEDPYQPPSLKDVTRSEAKAVINSAIGGGTWRQTQPTKMMSAEGIGQKRLKEIRDNLIPTYYECLSVLKKGELYSETLAWHETEIMMRLVELLQQPIFILHDCLICQKDTALDVGKALQKQFTSYCKEQGWTSIKPAFSIEYLEGETVVKQWFSGHFEPCK